MYIRGYDRIYCYDWSIKPKIFDKITITPASVTLAPGTNKQFLYLAYDEYNVPLEVQPTPVWSVSGGGSITPSGLYTANTAGIDTVVVSATADGKTLSAKAVVTVTASQTITCPDYTDSVFTNSPPFMLGCTASSGLPVTYTKQSGPFTLVNGVFTPLGVTGTARIIVKQAGDSNWLPATDYLLVFTIQLATGQQAITAAQKPVIYPNPSSGILSINGCSDGCDIYLFNILGNTVFYRNNFSDQQIDISYLKPGMYFLTLQSGASIHNLKLIKE